MTWIKINEDRSNLPSPCSDVLVTMKRTIDVNSFETWVIVAYFDGDRMFYDLHDYLINSSVIAWMELPKPYME